MIRKHGYLVGTVETGYRNAFYLAFSLYNRTRELGNTVRH